VPSDDSTQRPSLPGEKVQMSPAFAQVAGGSALFVALEGQPVRVAPAANATSAASAGNTWDRTVTVWRP
jgi:hypothetical protein